MRIFTLAMLAICFLQPAIADGFNSMQITDSDVCSKADAWVTTEIEFLGRRGSAPGFFLFEAYLRQVDLRSHCAKQDWMGATQLMNELLKDLKGARRN